MRISQTIRTIAANYEGDGDISVVGLMPTGDIIQMVIDDFEGVDYIWPGCSFLPYGGIYYNRLIIGLADVRDAVAAGQLKDLADSIKAGDDYWDDDYSQGCESIANHCESYPYN